MKFYQTVDLLMNIRINCKSKNASHCEKATIVESMRRGIEKEVDFEIIEMETDKDHTHLLVKSKPKVSIFAIIRKLNKRQQIEYVKLKNSL